jgi:hypothetical protein
MEKTASGPSVSGGLPGSTARLLNMVRQVAGCTSLPKS